jgi:uncharacterized alkaline shock family protein YloU
MQNSPGGRITPPDGTPAVDIGPNSGGAPAAPPSPSPFARKATEVVEKQKGERPDMNLPATNGNPVSGNAPGGVPGGAVVPTGPTGPPGPEPGHKAEPVTSAPVAARVKGRIDIADEVIEKVAAAAAYEVEGVADLGSDVGNALERMRERIGIGKKDDSGGVGVDIAGGEAEIDVPITVKYGHALIDVARRVQANVAHQLNLMLGLKITAVNVTIDDIEMPEDALSYKEDDGDRGAGGGGGFSISV